MKTKSNRQNKKGISLIVLVITIIVMIILAAAIIISLSNNGIIGKANEAVEQTDKKQVETMAQVVWGEAYAEGARTKEQLQSKIDEKLDQEIKDKYIVEATEQGVYVTPNSQWVTTTVDGVPIPKGFVASPYKGENTRAGGLVIYELGEDETDLSNDADEHESKTTRNQYVWVPVSDLSTNKFERVNWHQGVEGYEWIKLTDKLGIDFWEVTPNIKNIDLTATYDNPEYVRCWDEKEYETAEECIVDYGNPTLKAADFATQKAIDEVTEMYDSVATYGGFYIARYEAGLESKRTEDDGEVETAVYSMMNKMPYNNVGWSDTNDMNNENGGAVQVARSLYPKTNANYGVVSTLTYGVQWDAVVQWFKDKGKNVLDSTEYGNCYNNAITKFNKDAQVSRDNGASYDPIAAGYSKTDKQSRIYTTGATEEARVNNIYDMAGNLYEWTMEGLYAYCRVLRGGSFHGSGGDDSVSYRVLAGPDGANFDCGFRSALYIKK